MFKVGEIVWHSQFKRGEVAYAMGTDIRVMFEDVEQNPLINTEPPPYIKKKDLKELPIEERVQWTETTHKADIDGHTIYWDADLKRAVPTLPTGREDPRFKYPMISGYFLVVKATQTMGLKTKENEQDSTKSELKFFPREHFLDMKLKCNRTGTTYNVQIDRREYPAFYTARKMPPESLSVLFEEEDVFRSPEKEEPEQPKKQPESPKQ